MQTRFSSGRFTRRLASVLCASAMLCSLSACSMPRLAGRAEAEAQMSPCEKAMTLAGYATHPAEGTPLLEQYATGLAAPLAWIDVAGYCSGRFAEGTLRDAQTKQWLAFLADKFGQSAPEVTPARLDGVTSANVDRSVLDAMAVAEDRAGFAIEVLAARGQTAGATLALSDMHKTAGQQLVAILMIPAHSPVLPARATPAKRSMPSTNYWPTPPPSPTRQAARPYRPPPPSKWTAPARRSRP